MKVSKTVAKKSCEWWTKKIKVYNKKQENKMTDSELKECQSKFTEKFTKFLLDEDYEGALYYDLGSVKLLESFQYSGLENPIQFFFEDPLKMKIQNNSIYVSTHNENYTKIY